MGRGSSALAGGGGGAASNVAKNPVNITDEQAQALRDQYESGFDADTLKSIDKYISKTAVDNQSHSMSQVANFLISRGVDLNNVTAQEINDKYNLGITEKNVIAMRKMSNNIDKAMHPLGMDMNLERGAHAGQFGNLFGISNFSFMSESQLKDAMVGKAFQNTAVWSTSYNASKNPFTSPSSPVSGGREVIYRIKAGANTKCVFGAADQAEIVLGKGTNFKVTNVAFTGKTAHPKSGGAIKQIVVDIETF